MAGSTILSITVTQSLTNKTGTGTVTAWDAATRSLQVKDAASDKTESFTAAPNATVQLNDVNLKFDQLKVGDIISYEVKSGLVTSIVVTKTEQPTVSGVLIGIDKKEKTIQYTVNNQPAAKYLSDNVNVKIEGYTNVTLDDVVKGDAVTLTVNDAGKVTLITVMNRSVNTLYAATVISYVPKAKTLIVTDTSGVKHNLDITNTTRFDLNGALLSLETAAPLFSVEGRKINVSISGNSAVFISLVAKYSGKVIEHSVSAKTIKLTLDSGSNVTIPYTYPAIEIYGQASTTFTDIHVGDMVTVLLASNDAQQATSILLEKTVQLEVASVDLSLNKIGIKRNDGKVDQWTVSSAMTLLDDNGNEVGLNSIAVGNVVNVTFQGNTPIKVKKVPVTFGKVSAVNAASNSIDLITPSGAVVTRTVGTSTLIVRENTTLTSLTAIQTDDRVEIRRDENDHEVIEIIPAKKQTILRYDTLTQYLFVKEKSTDSTSSVYYALHPNVYIHKGTTILKAADLKYDDIISVFVLRGRLLEVSL